MSVSTRFSEHLDNLNEAVKKSQTEIAELINPNTSGHDDYSNAFKSKLFEVATKLNEIYQLLNP